MAASGPGRLERLAGTRFATRIAMVTERLWPLVLPVLLVAGLFLVASWFGLFRLLPDAGRYAALAAFGLAALAALYPLRFFRLPTDRQVDRRIETANTLQHAPVSTQTDRLVGADDAFSGALWREHQRRMAEKLGQLASDTPRPRVPERDPWGLRAIVPLLLVVAFAYSSSPYGGTMSDAFRAHVAGDVPPVRIDAWVTPPPYTGRAPIFMTAEANRNQTAFSVPEGSAVSLRVTGGLGDETLTYAGRDGVAIAIDPEGTVAATTEQAGAAPARPSGTRQFAHTLGGDGALVLKSGETELGGWTFSVTPDNPPVIAFADEPKRAVNGTLELAYTIEDDYGAASARAIIERRDDPGSDARPLYAAPEMGLSLPRRNAREAKTSQDLTEHPWAGVETALRLAAVDAAGQEAFSEERRLRLPERPFSNPLARAVVEQRRVLALDANRKPRVLDLMDAITIRPEDTFTNMSHYLAIRSARSRLVQAQSDDQLREVVDYLWEIALGIEEGDLSAAERRLRAAQEALKNAIENGASDEEIEQLMAELREAMQEFLREFAERAARDPKMAMPEMQMDGQELRQSDIDRMLDQIEEMAKSGMRDQAQQLLSQLQDMMNNLQAGRQQQQQGGQQSEMRQQMDQLGELMRRQQEMMNETHRLDQMQRGQRQRGQNRGEQRGEQGQQPGHGQQPGQGQGMSPEEFAEALRQLQEGQGQLQSQLDQLMEGLRGMGIEPGEGFGEAGEAMGEAGSALGEAQGERAVGEQGRALEALRRGAQDMMQQMQQAQQGDQGGSGEGGRQQSSDRDPLGRPKATTGPDFGESVQVPDEIDVQRAREILEAIRKRLGDALSPELERQYLERLLDIQ
ncbi:TIGR02302 family protein [Aquibium sp. ELW1220]|uniref:TIGR02302 family protein n=1 Tax=Aquibium sp. ELW1220 TaxID=2976766 RepID=UPI0025B0EAAD|nr:TIGR02302 family protein [Aquibium sp. ELW1220]MDN2578635.1 TIGR02302 family protein [Aquibium sp. ELW1220]